MSRPAATRQERSKERSWSLLEAGYRLRKHTVKPVFGQIKEARGFRQANVKLEWGLVCTVHNLLKLASATAAHPMRTMA